MQKGFLFLNPLAKPIEQLDICTVRSRAFKVHGRSFLPRAVHPKTQTLRSLPSHFLGIFQIHLLVNGESAAQATFLFFVALQPAKAAAQA